MACNGLLLLDHLQRHAEVALQALARRIVRLALGDLRGGRVHPVVEAAGIVGQRLDRLAPGLGFVLVPR